MEKKHRLRYIKTGIAVIKKKIYNDMMGSKVLLAVYESYLHFVFWLHVVLYIIFLYFVHMCPAFY